MIGSRILLYTPRASAAPARRVRIHDEFCSCPAVAEAVLPLVAWMGISTDRVFSHATPLPVPASQAPKLATLEYHYATSHTIKEIERRNRDKQKMLAIAWGKLRGLSALNDI
jgi:hypothetical protein